MTTKKLNGPMKKTWHSFPGGFTLAELLIALAVLGVIATFTIPKVLQANQDAKYKSMAKELAGTVSAAFAAYQADRAVTAATRNVDLTPYMNYVKIDTTSQIDSALNDPAGTPANCDVATCIKLHNGAMVQFTDHLNFGNTNPLDYVPIMIDPSGKYEGKNDALYLDLYFNGKITSLQNRYPNSLRGDVLPLVGPCAGCDPPWFNWN